MEFPTISETFVINHIVSLLDMGHDVYVFTLKTDKTTSPHEVVNERKLYELVRPLDQTIGNSKIVRFLRRLNLLVTDGWREPGITIRSLDPRIGSYTAYNLSLFASTRAFEGHRTYFDIVHCHFAWSGIIGARLKKAMAFQGKLVTTFHGSDVNVTGAIGSNSQRQLMFNTTDWFTANTNFIKNRAVALGCPNDRCSIWHMGVDLPLFNFHVRTVADGEPIRILTVARLVETKGVEYVIRALPLIKHRANSIEYHIVGEGPLRNQLEQLACELGVTRQVIFHGACSAESVRKHLDRSHIFVLASITASNNASEGQPVVLIEAQAAGLPVVATRLAGIPEAVLDGESAFLVPERSSRALADRLDELIVNSQTWATMGRAGRRFVEQEFSLRKCTDVINAVYETLLSSK